MSILHLFDLDYTLIDSRTSWVVIDKREPHIVLTTIDEDKIGLMSSYYAKYGYHVSYNGYNFYLHPSQFKRLKKLKKDINLKNIGITQRRFHERRDVERKKQKVDFIKHNTKHLPRNAKTGVLTARSDKEGDEEILDEIAHFFDQMNVSLEYIYFVNERDKNTEEEISAYRKAATILEHLTGYSVDYNSFKNIPKDQYSHVKFYDDNHKNFEAVNNLQTVLEDLWEKTENKLHNKLKRNIKNNKPKVENFLVTQNEVNPFVRELIHLQVPVYYKKKEETDYD